MKQAKSIKREFKDLSAWDILTGEAEKKKHRLRWDEFSSLYAAARGTGKTMFVDYMIGIQSAGRGLRDQKEITFKVLKSRNEIK